LRQPALSNKAIPAAVPPPDIDRILGPLLAPALEGLANRLEPAADLTAGERRAVVTGAAAALRGVVWRAVQRLVMVEWHAARITGQLAADDADGDWDGWVEVLAAPGGWEKVGDPYPDLLPRLTTLITNRCAAVGRLADRFCRDRPALARLLGAEPGELAELTVATGAGRHGGQTDAVLRLDAGSVVYRPRPVAAEVALARLLDHLLPDAPPGTRIRVADTLAGHDDADGYGWVSYVPHRHCRDDGERRTFYRGIGQWLAVMRLLRGGDLNATNVVAAGPVPVVVDAEALFRPLRPAPVDGHGAAVAQVAELLAGPTLRTATEPDRPAVFGWWGGDVALTGRIGAGPEQRRHHPGPEPDLGDCWMHVVDGYRELTARLRAMDASGELAPALAGFADCPVRVVLRDDAIYDDLIRMLWHPSSLFEPGPAVARATDLLGTKTAERPGAPGDPAVPGDPTVIAAEVAELRGVDRPAFTTIAGHGVIAGPRGVTWGPPQDLPASALRAWRAADPDADHEVARATLICAYLNDGWMEEPGQRTAPPVPVEDLARCRRRQAARIMHRLVGAAIHGGDGTVTWVAPMLQRNRWSVRVTSRDIYEGYAGIAVLLAGYRHEVTQGRADPVPGLEPLLASVVRTLRTGVERGTAPGAYVGLAGQVWCWLLLHRLGVVSTDEALTRAEAAAERLPAAVAADETYDLLGGAAGAIVPLLRLAEATGNARWRHDAGVAGQRLQAAAQWSDSGACWPSGEWETSTIGVSHGSYGVGWALARLAHAAADRDAALLADAAFGWGESQYRPQRQGWFDTRPSAPDQPLLTWCHGSAGIGLVAADLLSLDPPRWTGVLRRAAAATWPAGFDLRFMLCHGEAGNWEVMDRAWRSGVGPDGIDRESLVARIVGALAEHGPGTGVVRDVFKPGLMIGSGGVAYQLLRMDPECALPSVLLPDPGATGGDTVSGRSGSNGSPAGIQ
jgi:lantibiotic modifying enzyme